MSSVSGMADFLALDYGFIALQTVRQSRVVWTPLSLANCSVWRPCFGVIKLIYTLEVCDF